MHLFTLFLEEHGEAAIFSTLVTVGGYLNLLLDEADR